MAQPKQSLDGAIELEDPRVGRAAPSSELFDILEGTADAFGEVIGDVVQEVSGIVGGGETTLEQEAAYFARCVEDPEMYPPLNDEMAELAESRRSYERTLAASREAAGFDGELTAAGEKWMTEDRMQEYMDNQQSYSR